MRLNLTVGEAVFGLEVDRISLAGTPDTVLHLHTLGAFRTDGGISDVVYKVDGGRCIDITLSVDRRLRRLVWSVHAPCEKPTQRAECEVCRNGGGEGDGVASGPGKGVSGDQVDLPCH